MALVLSPDPVICAHLSSPNCPHVDPVGMLAGPWPPQSKTIEPSFEVATYPLSLSRISPESSLVTVLVVVVVSVVVVTVYPSASYSIVSVIVSSIISSIVGVQSPTVSVEQSTALLEKDRETDIHSHSQK